MRMEIVLGDEVFHATLFDETAPNTVKAVAKAMPFEGRAVHAQLSGEMFRMFEQAPIDVETMENQESFQYPGEIVYFPPIREIAIAYGTARFRGTASPVYLTPLGQVDELEIPRLAKAAARLQWDGAKRIQFRPSTTGEHVAQVEPGTREIVLEMDGTSAVASLLTGAPKTGDALWNALPLSGQVTNATWSGQILRFWGGDGKQGEVPIKLDAENGQVLYWPGYVYFVPANRGLRVCYGQGQYGGPTSVLNATPLAKITGDWRAFRAKAQAIMFEGAKTLTIRRKEA